VAASIWSASLHALSCAKMICSLFCKLLSVERSRFKLDWQRAPNSSVSLQLRRSSHRSRFSCSSSAHKRIMTSRAELQRLGNLQLQISFWVLAKKEKQYEFDCRRYERRRDLPCAVVLQHLVDFFQQNCKQRNNPVSKEKLCLRLRNQQIEIIHQLLLKLRRIVFNRLYQGSENTFWHDSKK